MVTNGMTWHHSFIVFFSSDFLHTPQCVQQPVHPDFSWFIIGSPVLRDPKLLPQGSLAGQQQSRGGDIDLLCLSPGSGFLWLVGIFERHLYVHVSWKYQHTPACFLALPISGRDGSEVPRVPRVTRPL